MKYLNYEKLLAKRAYNLWVPIIITMYTRVSVQRVLFQCTNPNGEKFNLNNTYIYQSCTKGGNWFLIPFYINISETYQKCNLYLSTKWIRRWLRLFDSLYTSLQTIILESEQIMLALWRVKPWMMGKGKPFARCEFV